MVFLIKIRVAKLFDQFVEALFVNLVDVIERLFEVGGGGVFLAARGARGAKQEVVGFDARFEQVELAGVRATSVALGWPAPGLVVGTPRPSWKMAVA